LPESFGALRERDFRLLFLGQAISWLGTGMAPLALAFAVLDVTHSPSDLGIVLAARALPNVAFLLLGGVFADRLPRRAVMIGADLTRVASQGVLAGLLIFGVAHLSEIVLLVVVGGAATAFFNPAVTGLVPQTVSVERLQEANALRSASASLGTVLGPSVAGVLVATVGPGSALALDAASFGISAVYLTRLRLAPDERLPAQTLLHDLTEGWREFRSRSWLLWSNLHALLATALVLAPYAVLGPVVAKRSLGGPGAWAVISASFGVGSVVGGGVALRWKPRRPLFVGLALTIVDTPLLALLALRAQVAAVAVAAFAGGVALIFLNTLWETTIQEQVPPRLVSRITAYDLLASTIAYPLGLALAGILAAHVFGVSGMLWIGAGSAAGLTVFVFCVPSVRELEARRAQPP
jgi:MFS family permease